MSAIHSTAVTEGVTLPRGRPIADGPRPDDDGFRQWVVARSGSLRRKAFLLSGDWHQADDLLQDTLLAMYPKWSRIASGGNVDAYANRVLVGKFIDGRRRRWRGELPTEVMPEGPDEATGRALEGVTDADRRLTRALAGLSPEHRAVIVLRFTDDLPVDEIAQLLQVPPGTVKSRLSRATASLRDALETSGREASLRAADRWHPDTGRLL